MSSTVASNIMNLNRMEEAFDEIGNMELASCELSSPKGCKLKSALTNLAFNLKNNYLFQLPFSSRSPLQFSNNYEKVFMLGHPYDLHSREDFHRAFSQIIWFTYRRLSKCVDVGWGCMIRVIQMMIAEVVKRDRPCRPLDQVIDLFREEGEGQLALSTICKVGNLGARWTSCPEILSVVSSILAEMKEQHEVNFTFQFFCDVLEIKGPEEYAQQDFPKLVAIHSKVGTGNTITADYFAHLFQLMKDKRFVGFASGHKTEALYVLGTFNNLAIILDPHYVQEEETFDTFFCKNPQGIPFTELANGISISFYIPSLEHFYQWIEEMLYAYRISLGYSCFKVKVSKEESWGTGRRKGSDDFQVLFDEQ